MKDLNKFVFWIDVYVRKGNEVFRVEVDELNSVVCKTEFKYHFKCRTKSLSYTYNVDTLWLSFLCGGDQYKIEKSFCIPQLLINLSGVSIEQRVCRTADFVYILNIEQIIELESHIC